MAGRTLPGEWPEATSEEDFQVGGDDNVRWVLAHMIEEVARHAGHADIIRETLGGSRGI